MDQAIENYVDHQNFEYQSFRRKKTSQELFDQNVYFWKSKIFFEIWQLLFKVDKEDKYIRRYLMYDIRITEGIDTGYAEHISMYHDIILMWILSEVTFVFFDFSPSKTILHSVSLTEEVIRNEEYTIGDILSFAIGKINEIWSVRITYKIDREKAIEFIDKSIEAWLRNNSIPNDIVLWTRQKQIEEVAKFICKTYSLNRNRPIWIMSDDLPEEIDLPVTLIYLEKNRIIEIKKPHTSLVGTYIPMIDIRIKDIPALTQLTKTESEKKISSKAFNWISQNVVSFDKDTWQVFIDWDEVWVITTQSQKYYFFEFLYDRYNQPMVHMDISNYVRDKSSSKSAQSKDKFEVKLFLSWLKGKLPKKIKPYIYGHKWTYQLRNFPNKKTKNNNDINMK